MILIKGAVIGASVGPAVVAVAGVAITYHELHKGIAEGCVVELDGKKTLNADQKVYSLLETGSSVPVGQKVKVKGQKAGSKPDLTLKVDKILKVYGPC